MQTTSQKPESISHPLFAGILRAEIHSTVTPLLELAVTASIAQGAYLYYFDRLEPSASLILWSGLPPAAGPVPLEVDGPTAAAHFRRDAPIIVQQDAWLKPGFEALPEFRTNRFEGVLSIPLLDSGAAKGMVNICHSHSEGTKAPELSFLLSLAAPIAGFLAAAQARLNLAREVDRLSQRLSDRKILDRAKGLIQSRFEWTEEQAYFCIRNLSRRRRTSMRLVAKEVIETGASHIVWDGGRP